MRLFPYYRWPRLREAAFITWPLLSFRLSAERALLAALRRENPKEILEIGCGRGSFSRRMAYLLPGAKVISLDNEPKMVDAANQGGTPPNLHFVVGDFYTTPLKAETVVLFHVFVLFWPYEEALRRLWEITERLALLTLTAPGLFSKAHRVIHRNLTGMDVYPIEPQKFLELSEKSGFKGEWFPVNPLERSYLVLLRK